jgi:hypothetical protein
MAFMVPTASYFTHDEVKEYDLLGLGEYDDTDPQGGYYGYLSADGYMDRTDYSGPFSTAEEAWAYVMDLYSVDQNGESTDAD